MDYEAIVKEVVDWFEESSPGSQQEFVETPKDKLIKYHSNLGRSIRNEFNLWDNKWVPEVVDGVDISPNHPDAVSMRIIRDVWDRVKVLDTNTKSI